MIGEGGLDEEGNVQFLQNAGSDKPVGFCSLDVIVPCRHRVKSLRGKQFRFWAGRTLRDHLRRGHALEFATP